MTICVHHIAAIAAKHDPETHWLEVEFLDRMGVSTKMHWYTLREDSAAEQAFAAEITAALNALSKFRPKVEEPFIEPRQRGGWDSRSLAFHEGSSDQGVDQ